MVDGGRRPGDWQRKDVRQGANDLAGQPDPRNWYDQTFWVVAFLLVLWPVGIVLVWRSSWRLGFKVAASLYVAVAVLFSFSLWQNVLQMQQG